MAISGNTLERRLVTSFGSERADDDFAREDEATNSIFLQTREIDEYLLREPEYAYVCGTMGAGKSILLLKKWAFVEQRRPGAIVAPRSAGRVFTPSATFANSVRWQAFWQLEVNGQPNIDAWT